ncbi:Fmu (Sun) domain-containing protein [Neosynechococcus sphagnicola sy1]|uniref:Fmu (Sun) domain-containing protein n=1 Tax=Neosynechococcus sphagnicola sy1 TaxID=1497020 RepID=A0A098TLB6_9CYAN|nr:RsmB/NOP family class I SAM-dependent RNA methyltransferase [Neosynechococcus sphagnicola]KGF73089.1 Fmu (Sun) domain-containing protein [Neosynechococcus sphagnicola sy1]
MDQPSKLLLKLSRQLFSESAQQGQFLDRILHPRPYLPCVLWCQPHPPDLPFTLEPATSWQPPFVDRLALGSKPGQTALHEQGYFYCLDFSSVFAASVLCAIPSPIACLIDVCAAPGGKSIFAWVALQPAVLVSNEVIRKRLGMLIANLRRCQIQTAVITSLDSQVLAATIPHTAQVVLVDAPCSGQSLLAKGDRAPGCFHPVSINKNANRQKRILANASYLVAPQGYLAYMTCTYSPEENERIINWFLEQFPQFRPMVIPHLMPYQSHLTTIPCYRMWPQEGLGAGAFTALFQNTETGDTPEIAPAFLQQARLIL